MDRRKLFRDRIDAGRRLAAALGAYRDQDPLVLGLARGGVPVAYEVARHLETDFDVCIVRTICDPVRPELAIGAVAEGGIPVVSCDVRSNLRDEELNALIDAQWREVNERIRSYRDGAPPIDVRGRTVLLVDDGVTSGCTARAALRSLRVRGAAQVVLAVPVGTAKVLQELASDGDEIVCLHYEEPCVPVGLWYEEFPTTTDDDVIAVLRRSRLEHEGLEPRGGRDVTPPCPPSERDLRVTFENASLDGHLSIPDAARGLVIVADGTDGGAGSRWRTSLAWDLHRQGFATLLLGRAEDSALDHPAACRQSGIGRDVSQLIAATDWAHEHEELAELPIAYCGAGAGAAAVLEAAAARPSIVRAVVLGDGGTDVSPAVLGAVRAPTLFLAGEADPALHGRDALNALASEKRIEVFPGVAHVFGDHGAFEHVARSVGRWYSRWVAERGSMPPRHRDRTRPGAVEADQPDDGAADGTAPGTRPNGSFASIHR